MKREKVLIMILISAWLLSSCGAIPTLPPLESTVSVRTPQITIFPGTPTETAAETTSEPLSTHTVTPAATATPLPPTAEPSSTPTEYLTATPAPSSTPRASATSTATPTATPVPYTAQILNPYYLANFAHPELGCSWMGIAGQVFNSAGVVQKEILIKAGGTLNGSQIVEQMTMPLAEPETDQAYGPGGYELTLADEPSASQNSIWVQLFSLAGDPLSEKVSITTYDDCQRNLILLNFVEP